MSYHLTPEGELPSSAGIREPPNLRLLSNPPIPAAAIMETTPVVDTSPQIWSICLSHADKFDRALVETWKGDMDGILIFVGFHIDLLPSCLLKPFLQSGLFSAVVTAFLIISYPGLQPDVATINANLTAQVGIILAQSANQSGQVNQLQELQNRLPPQNSRRAYLIINALWFLSLAFGLACALAATLVQQWSRTYLQGTEERFNPHQRVRMRTYLQRGVQKFHFSELVDAIPMWVDLYIWCRLYDLMEYPLQAASHRPLPFLLRPSRLPF
jgi:hypothetical protein